MAEKEIPDSLKHLFAAPAPAAEAPSGGAPPSSLQGLFDPSVTTGTLQPGMRPNLALPESPLGPIERAAFGYAKYPKDQMNYLEERFGKGNAQMVKMDEGSANYVVKGEDNIWRQVDPHGISDIPMDLVSGEFGQAVNRIKNFNLRNTIGGAGQLIGEKGTVMAGAAMGAGQAVTYGSPLIAASGPFAPLTAAGLAIGGGIMGGGAGSIVDAGVREASAQVEQATGQPIMGAHKYDVTDLSQQVMGDMIFGATQEAGGQFLKAAGKGIGKGAARMFANTLEMLGDTPASKQAQASLIKTMSGIPDGLARAWADEPKAVAEYVPMAIKDKVNNTDNLLTAQKAKIDSFYDSAQSAMRTLGKQYDVIENKASTKVLDALGDDSPIMDSFNKLRQQGYLGENFEPRQAGTNEITRDMSGTNGQAIKKVTDDFHALLSKDGKMTYQESRIMERNIEGYLFGQNQVTDGGLRNILGQLRSSINTVQSKGLYEIDPELSNQLAQLNAKYGPAKELLGTLGQKSKDQRLDAFLKQLIRNDGSYNAEMMNSVGNVLGIDNPTKDILQMEVAKKSVPWFTGAGSVNLMGVKLPASPAATRGVVNGVIAPMQTAQTAVTDAAQAVLKKTSSVYRALPDNMKMDFVKDPAAVGTLNSLMSGSVVQEQQDKSKLLKDSGAFQGSQFGTPQ